MQSPLPLPDWLPWWVHLLVLLALGFVALTFVMMPFSTFGTKSRLDVIEARLDEIQGEIRSLAFRLPERAAFEPDEDEAPRPRLRAPIPPAPMVPPRDGRRAELGRPTRSEPRLY